MKRHYLKTIMALALSILYGSTYAQEDWAIQQNRSGEKVEAPQPLSTHPSIPLGYAPVGAQIWQDDGLGGLTEDTKIGAAIKLTRPMLERYIGAKLVSLNSAWCNRQHNANITFFIRKELQGNNIASGTGHMTFGWNTNKFDTPYVIPENVENLYIGYYVDVPKNAFVIPVFPIDVKSDACYLWKKGDMTPEGQEYWEDFSDLYGALSVQVIAEGEPGQFDNMLTIKSVRYNHIQATETEAPSFFTVSNLGMNEVNSVELTYKQGEKVWSSTYPLNRPIAPAETFEVNLPVYAMATGSHTATISKVNDHQNNIDNSYNLSLIAVPESVSSKYVRRPLIEFWESENSFRVPTFYDEYFLPGYEKYAADMTLVSHHLGDQFMQGDDEDTKMMLDFVNNDSMQVSIPSIMADRMDILNYPGASGNTPAVMVPFPDFAYMVYDVASAMPTFAKVAVKADYNEEKSTGKIDVTGTIEPGILPAGENLYLTVYVIEDNIKSDSQEFNDEEESNKYNGVYTHDNIIRFRPTPLYGEQLVKDGDFLKSYDVTFEPEWKAKDMRVVAFINRGIENPNMSREVINSSECKFSGVSSIDNLSDSQLRLYTHENKIFVEGEYDHLSVYDLSGRRILNENLMRGIYIVKVTSKGCEQIQKVNIL